MNKKYKDGAMKPVVRFLFFREPWKDDYLTNTHTQSVENKKFY